MLEEKKQLELSVVITENGRETKKSNVVLNGVITNTANVAILHK